MIGWNLTSILNYTGELESWDFKLMFFPHPSISRDFLNVKPALQGGFYIPKISASSGSDKYRHLY